MTLRVVLKPGERVCLNGAIIEVCQKTILLLHNRAALLRCNEMIAESDATTPAKRLYFDIMNVTLAGEHAQIERDRALWSAERMRRAPCRPQTAALLSELVELLLAGQAYKALMRAKKLIKIEAAAAPRMESHALDPPDPVVG